MNHSLLSSSVCLSLLSSRWSEPPSSAARPCGAASEARRASPPPRATHAARGDSAPCARSGGKRARGPRVRVASLPPAASSRCVRARAPLPTPAAGAWRACFTQGTARDARGARAIPALRGAPAAGGARSAVRPLASLRPSRLVLLSVARRRSARAPLRPPALTRRRCVRGERRAQGEPRSGRLARGRPCAPRRGPSLSPSGLWRVLVPPRALVFCSTPRSEFLRIP